MNEAAAENESMNAAIVYAVFQTVFNLPSMEKHMRVLARRAVNN
jgi:hypothetical protein